MILFDGVCNLCNTWVDLILKVDRGKKFRFCPLQSDTGRALMAAVGRDPDDMSTIVLIKSLATQETYIKSKAVLKVVEQLTWPFRVLSAVGSVVPNAVRDKMYDAVAANRYKMLGKRDQCRAVTPDDADRFIM